jgi:hypothetical protein
MKHNKSVNAKDLLRQAKASEHKEAYQLMSKTANYRVGIGARLPSAPTQTSTFFIEIIINLCPTCSAVDLVFLERALTCLKALQLKGYCLTCQDDNSILCEKLVTEQNLHNEFEKANAIIGKEIT